MNGRDLTLGLVGALAVGAALGRRGSRASAETLYHGGTEEVRAPRAGIFLTPDLQTASTYARYGPNQSRRTPQAGVVSAYALDPKAFVQTFRSFADAYAHYGVRSSQALARTAVQRREADVVAVYDERILVHPSVVSWIGSEPVAKEGSRATDPTSTEAFRRWFGDSEVVDAEGRPLVVYHGTSQQDFDRFDPERIGQNFAQSRGGFFFVSSKDAAWGYADSSEDEHGGTPRVVSVYLSLENPLVVEASHEVWPDMYFDDNNTDILRRARRGGHDGVIVHGIDPYSDGEPRSIYIAFRPEQIKSATGNRGTFDPADPRISYNRGVR
jgi:hypothetical protein